MLRYELVTRPSIYINWVGNITAEGPVHQRSTRRAYCLSTYMFSFGPMIATFTQQPSPSRSERRKHVRADVRNTTSPFFCLRAARALCNVQRIRQLPPQRLQRSLLNYTGDPSERIDFSLVETKTRQDPVCCGLEPQTGSSARNDSS